jgi:choline monooxygenase
MDPVMVSTGGALHPSLYLDPELEEREQRLIFERTWQLAGHVSSLRERGSYVTAWAGNQPVLVVRDEDGSLRAFRNVCRHRGSMLLTGSGQCKNAIRCRYHGWTYKLDGTLIGLPEVRAFGNDLDKSALGLFPARVEEWCGLVFVNLDPDAAPFASLVEGLAERLARYNVASLVPFSPYDGEEPANWKVVAENYLDGYHIPIAHPALVRLLDYKRYEADIHDHWVWFEAPHRESPTDNWIVRLYSKIVQPMPGLSAEDLRVWRYVFIYPNTILDIYPDQMNTWQIRPTGVDSTHDHYEAYRPTRNGLRTRVAQRLNLRLNTIVAKEDIDLVDNVQRGLATRDYECGPLSERDAALAWFADRIRGDLGL